MTIKHKYSFFSSGEEAIINAYNYSKNKMPTCVDVLCAIINDNDSIASKTLRDFNLSYSQIMSTRLGITENEISIDRLCFMADKISKLNEDNSIGAEHLLLAILSCTNKAATCLMVNNINLIDVENILCDNMGRSGFLYSYLQKESFWEKHFDIWIQSCPLLQTKRWLKHDCESYCRFSDCESCGLIIKEVAKTSEIIINRQIESFGKCLFVQTSRQLVAMVKPIFISFALGRFDY